MPRSVWFGTATLLVAVALAVLMVFVPGIRIVLVAPLLLYVPGLLIGGALSRGYRMLGTELTVIAISLSFVIAVLGGLLLAVLPRGLSPTSWAFYYAGVALLALGIWRLGRGTWWPSESRASGAKGRAKGRSSRPWRGPVLAFAGALGVAALVIAAVASANDHDSFTELAVAPAGSAGAPAVQITVANHEGRAMEYRVVITSQGSTLARFDKIRLDPGRTWQATSRLTNRSAQAILNIGLYLPVASSTAPYRNASVSVAWAEGQP